jgi:hypothetical protein
VTAGEAGFMLGKMVGPFMALVMIILIAMHAERADRYGERWKWKAWLLFSGALLGCLVAAFFLAGGLMCLTLVR